MSEVMLAGALEQVGDHLLGVGQGWADAALALILAVLVGVKVAQKFSIKAGIGAAIGMVLCLGIYDSRQELRDDVKDEITTVGSAPLEQVPAGRISAVSLPAGPVGAEGGGAA